MKVVYASLIVAIMCLGLVYNVNGLAGLSDYDSQDVTVDQKFDRLRHLVLNDAVPALQENYGFTTPPEYPPLEISASDDPSFQYMAASPYYKVYFKGTTVKMKILEGWIQFELRGEELGKEGKSESSIKGSLLSVLEVAESVDLAFEVETSVLKEVLVLKKSRNVVKIVQNISWGGFEPEFQEDGSILFVNENGKEIVKILPPFMKDSKGAVSKDLHYELAENETGYELHKVIDEKGLEWLKKAVYPVFVDPSMQTFEDAWESSGLTPYGQYFRNLKEYINPSNGHLTVTQTDLVIPGRGLDLVISRIYETPAVFYGYSPYDYEGAPVEVGHGWQLSLPYVGAKYLHLWNGTIYKISWVSNTFENHKGAHFVLVKNGDNTYTLTTASGVVYDFSSSGKLLYVRDLDQNTITFTYTDGKLTSITDTIGRTVSLTYTEYNQLHKIIYNSCELEFSYDQHGCLQWVEDFLNRRTSYSYNTGYNYWLLSKIEYPTAGYTTYTYDRFSDSDYYKYYVTDQRVYETSQVRHSVYSYTGNFLGITASATAVKNESDITQGSYHFGISEGLITQSVTKNGAGTPIRKLTYAYNSRKEVTQESVYSDGSNLSYTTLFAYDNWGNTIYTKNAEGHEQFFSYANTNTSGFFIDNTGAVVRIFTNSFTNCTVPSTVHTVLLGAAERQDETYVREMYATYDSEAHPTQFENSFGTPTTWLTFSGTFNEKTGQTSFPIDLSGHTITGNGVLQITGLPSDDTYTETRSSTCPYQPTICSNCIIFSSWWEQQYCKVSWMCCSGTNCPRGTSTLGPFTHYPGTLGYQSYIASAFSATTYWKAYPAEVKYNLDSSNWKTITSNLKNMTVQIAVPITDGQHTLYFAESSSQKTKFSWYLYVPVDNTLETYTTSMTYDTYGNIASITDAELNTISVTFSPTYACAYPTEYSVTVGSNTITTKATYDYYRGWITSLQQPKGVEAQSGYDILYTYDLLGRITKKEFPLLSGQSQRSFSLAIYDDTNITVTIVDPLGHFIIKEYDKLGRKIRTKWYTGTYGSGTLYATESYTYRYDNLPLTITDPGGDTTTYTFDFLGRCTQIIFPDSSTFSYSYDDTASKKTVTNGRNYDVIHWYDWLNRLTRVDEEYATDTFAVTTYQYDEIGHLTSFTDAENHTTTFTYSSLFGLTRTTYPDFTYEEYEYDNVGNVISFTDCNGNETTFTYDDTYRLTQVQYQDQSTVFFTYDLNSNRTRMDDDAPNAGDYVEYTYDEWNRLTTETRHISQSAYTVSYEYNVVNRLASLIYPDNMQILYSYDDLDRMTEIRRYVDGVDDEILMNNVQYDSEDLLTQFDYGNDLHAAFSYDSRDRLLTMDIKDGEIFYLDLDFTYDNNGNIIQLTNGWRGTDSSWNSEIESYSYDGLDRLVSASSTSWSHAYSYDEVGNRTAKDSINYSINEVNEITALSDGTSFIYDSNGNRIQKAKDSDTWTYAYDYANRLTRVEKNSVTLGEYTYDGDGKRIRATENGETTLYIYSGIDILYEETTTGSAAYVYGPVGRIAKKTAVNQETNTYYYLTDHLGSTRLVTDEEKNIISSITYHPFGESITEGGSEDYLFTGKEKDTTGLYYYGARYYDPDTGRFITRDKKLGERRSPTTLNKYTYCYNNPLRYIDSDGRETSSRYFKPEEPPETRCSLYWAYIRSQLLQWMFWGQLATDYYNWANSNPSWAQLFSWGAPTVGAAAAGGLIGALIGALLAVMYITADLYYADLWNDPQFVELWETIEMYLDQLVEGYDCEQEFSDACCELAVYLLQKKYGDEWREHAPPELLDYYDDMMAKKNPDSDGSEEDSSSSGGSSSNHPDRIPI